MFLCTVREACVCDILILLLSMFDGDTCNLVPEDNEFGLVSFDAD